MSQSKSTDLFGRSVRAMSRRLANTPRGGRVLDMVLSDAKVAAWIEHRIGANASRKSPPIDEVMPDRVDGGFDDLVWLFTPSPAARGISQLLLDEAVYIYQFLKSLPDPSVAEVGRWKGGTTFFFGAAGARVISLDIEVTEERMSHRGVVAPPFRPALERAVTAAGLDDRVELVKADAYAWSVKPEAYDLIYLDILPRSVDDVSKLFELWRVGLRDGGRLIFREGSTSGNQAAFVSTLGDRDDVIVHTDSPGSFAVVSNT